ncbi:MAG: hypothetical protein ACE365_04110 [Gammaproteobacteria bacterium]
MRENEIVLTVYFCSTDDPIKKSGPHDATLVSDFSNATLAIDITTEQALVIDENQCDYKMAFDGCGVTHGAMGWLFATGLEE